MTATHTLTQHLPHSLRLAPTQLTWSDFEMMLDQVLGGFVGGFVGKAVKKRSPTQSPLN